MQRAYVYVRYSSDNQRVESIDAQLRAIKEFCRKNNIEIVIVFADEALSAKTDDREQFLEMFSVIKKNPVDLLIVHKVDRFARNRTDAAIYKKILKDKGMRLVYVEQNLDDSPESVILESVLEGMAEYYSLNLAREVMKGMKETAYQAKHCGGIPPLGFDVKDRMYILNPTEAATVVRIFELYSNGYGYKKIARELNEEGRRTKKGLPFGINSIREILMNEKYTGTFVFNKQAPGRKGPHSLKESDKIIKIENALPEIVDRATFNKVQTKLTEQKFGPRIVENRYYLLTGLLRCGECGSNYVGNGYYTNKIGVKYPTYRCTNRNARQGCTNSAVTQKTIEAFLLKQMRVEIFTDAKIDKIAKKLIKQLAKTESSNSEGLKNLKEQLSTAQGRLNRLVDLYLDGTMDKTSLQGKTEALQGEVNRLRTSILQIEQRNYSWINEGEIKKFLTSSRDRLESKDKFVQRKVIETYVNELVIYKDKFEVDYLIRIDKTDNCDTTGSGGACLTLSQTVKRK